MDVAVVSRGRAAGAMLALLGCEYEDPDLDPIPPAIATAVAISRGEIPIGGEVPGEGTTTNGGVTAVVPPGLECISACDCRTGVGCVGGVCTPGIEVFCCSDPVCPPGRVCEDEQGNPSVCPVIPGAECVSACDCPPLVACIEGFCTPIDQPVFCCTDPSCPPGFACDQPLGTPGTCFDGVTTGL